MKRIHRYAAAAVALLVVLVITDCSSPTSYSYGGNPPPPPPPGNSPNTVVMSGTSFGPSSLTIKKGTAVTWQNASGAYGTTHTATSDSGAFDTGGIPPGGSKSITFSVAGTFPYHCIYHVSMGMRGTIIVQ